MSYDTTAAYPRDLIGYGRNPPHPEWPGQARIAVQFVLNYEEGGENTVLHGDVGSEQFLSEMFNPPSVSERHLSMEGIYEYGSRAGVWRILREFEQRGLPLTVFGVGMALQRHPDLTAAFVELGHEIACHGWRWINYQNVDEAIGRDSPQTRRLVADDGQLTYDSDYYGDDLPFWMTVKRTDGAVVPRLVVPYTMDTNDMRFSLPQGFAQAEDFFIYLRDSFDVLYAEGDANGLNAPKMLSIGMHCRLLGRPGRLVALQRFLDHVQQHDKVWVCRRIEIANHWQAKHPFSVTL
jgi:allantoinase